MVRLDGEESISNVLSILDIIVVEEEMIADRFAPE